MSTTAYGSLVMDVIRREYSPLKNASQILARHAGTSPKTANNWLYGINPPKTEQLITLMAHCDALADEVNRLVAAAKERRQTK